MLNARTIQRLTGGDDHVEFVGVEPVLGGPRGLGGCVEREVAGQWRMRNRCYVGRVGVSGLNIEFQDAEPSRVMCLGCVVDRGRIEGLFLSSGKGIFWRGESGRPKRPGGPVAWGKDVRGSC